MTPILNKKQSYALWQSGAFGTKLRSWRTIEDWRASGFSELVVLRTLLPGSGGSGPCYYNLMPNELEWHWSNLTVFKGIPREHLMINEAAPDQDVVLQGEYLNGICQDEIGAPVWSYFFHSTLRHHMRDALHLRPEHTYGLRTDALLRRAMTDASYEDWQGLLDQYPDHVLEVSIYNRCLGDIPGRNALVWEVRKY